MTKTLLIAAGSMLAGIAVSALAIISIFEIDLLSNYFNEEYSLVKPIQIKDASTGEILEIPESLKLQLAKEYKGESTVLVSFIINSGNLKKITKKEETVVSNRYWYVEN